jgi:hypothetical protein
VPYRTPQREEHVEEAPAPDADLARVLVFVSGACGVALAMHRGAWTTGTTVTALLFVLSSLSLRRTVCFLVGIRER